MTPTALEKHGLCLAASILERATDKTKEHPDSTDDFRMWIYRADIPADAATLSEIADICGIVRRDGIVPARDDGEPDWFDGAVAELRSARYSKRLNVSRVAMPAATCRGLAKVLREAADPRLPLRGRAGRPRISSPGVRRAIYWVARAKGLKEPEALDAASLAKFYDGDPQPSESALKKIVALKSRAAEDAFLPSDASPEEDEEGRPVFPACEYTDAVVRGFYEFPKGTLENLRIELPLTRDFLVRLRKTIESRPNRPKN